MRIPGLQKAKKLPSLGATLAQGMSPEEIMMSFKDLPVNTQKAVSFLHRRRLDAGRTSSLKKLMRAKRIEDGKRDWP